MALSRSTAAFLGLLAGLATLSGCAGDPVHGPAADTSGTAVSAPPVKPADPVTAEWEPTPADFAAVRSLLQRQAQAVLDGDRAAYLATIDRRNPRFVRRQRTLFANFRQLPVTSLRYGVGDAGMIAPDLPGDDPVLRPYVVEHTGLAGVYRRPIANEVDRVFVRRDEGWLLAAEPRPTDQHDFAAPQSRPWFGRPIRAARRGDVLVLTNADSPRSPADVLQDVRKQRARAAARLGVAEVPVLVDITSNGLASTVNTLSKEEAGAAAYPVFGTDLLAEGGRSHAGNVIQANPSSVGQLLEDRATMRHELTHLLLLRHSDGAPTWVTEGIAEYAAGYPDDITWVEHDLGRRALLRRERVLPTTGLFGHAPKFDYAIAHAAVSWLVETYGTDRFLRFLAAYGADPRGGDDATPRALRKVYGVTEKRLLEGAWEHFAAVGR